MTDKKILKHIDFAFRAGEEKLLEDLRDYAERNSLTQTKAVKELIRFALEAQRLGVAIIGDEIYLKKE